jgi:hypothetical protein
MSGHGGIRPRNGWSAGRTPWLARTAAVLTSLTLLVAGVSACGNAITVVHAGQVGMIVDRSGHPAIAVMTCSTATPVINMAEGRKPSDPDSQQNQQRGSWQARKGFAGVRLLPLFEPGDTWVTSLAPGTLEPERLFIVDGGTVEDKNASLLPVSFRVPDLARLAPDQVLVDGKVESLSAFGVYRCD